ncbi:hypothetical protein EJ02DRAFT_296533, partial [Clathrospora elynae]
APMRPDAYEYSPLDAAEPHIRLIKLSRHKPNKGAVRCDINTFALATAPIYSALSYERGPSTPHYGLLVDGRTLNIRQNLCHCLLELREGEEQYTRIDQICVNQLGVQ